MSNASGVSFSGGLRSPSTSTPTRARRARVLPRATPRTTPHRPIPCSEALQSRVVLCWGCGLRVWRAQGCSVTAPAQLPCCVRSRRAFVLRLPHVPPPRCSAVTMPHDIAARIEYSEKYQDDTYEYRYVRTWARACACSTRSAKHRWPVESRGSATPQRSAMAWCARTHQLHALRTPAVSCCFRGARPRARHCLTNTCPLPPPTLAQARDPAKGAVKVPA